jgi:Tfp pilus assembly protein PilF
MGRVGVWLAIIVALVCAGYSASIRSSFQFDDAMILVDPRARDVGRFIRAEALLDVVRGQRPLTWFTFALDHARAGFDATQFRVVNLFIHVVVVLLVFAFTMTTLRRAGLANAESAALVTTGMFALHPIQTQAVTYISQRAEILASAFFLIALLQLLWAGDAVSARRRLALGLTALPAFALAIAAKPIAVTLPLAYLLHAAYFPGRTASRLSNVRRALVVAVPFLVFGVGAIALSIRSIAGAPSAGFNVAGIAPSAYFVTELRVVPAYLRLLAWPSGQNIDHDIRVSGDPLELGALGGLALVVALVVGALAAVRWSRSQRGEWGAVANVASFGVFWFFLLLAPTSSFVPLADVMEEHRLYLASWGMLAPIALAGIVAVRGSRQRRIAGGLLIAGLGAGLTIALYSRNVVWRTPFSLWRDSVEKSPHKARPHVNLGVALAESGQLEAALAEYRIALSLASDLSVTRAVLVGNYVSVLSSLGRVGEGEALLDHVVARDPTNIDLLNRLAIVKMELGKTDDASRIVRMILAAAPRSSEAHHTAAQLLAMSGDTPAARREFEAALRLNPDDGSTLLNFGWLDEQTGMVEAACGKYGRAARSEADAVSATTARQRLAALHCPSR